MDRRGDLACAIAVMLYGVALVIATALQEPGPALDPLGKQALPYGTGVLLAIAGGYLVLRRLRTWRTETSNIVYQEGIEDEEGHPASVRGPLFVGTLLLAYAVALPYAGYLIATPLFITGGLIVLQRRGVVLLVVLPLVFTVTVFVVFSQLLSVPIPVGPLTDVMVDLGLIDRVR